MQDFKKDKSYNFQRLKRFDTFAIFRNSVVILPMLSTSSVQFQVQYLAQEVLRDILAVVGVDESQGV